jgi:hypothetical protein
MFGLEGAELERYKVSYNRQKRLDFGELVCQEVDNLRRI